MYFRISSGTSGFPFAFARIAVDLVQGVRDARESRTLEYGQLAIDLYQLIPHYEEHREPYLLRGHSPVIVRIYVRVPPPDFSVIQFLHIDTHS